MIDISKIERIQQLRKEDARIKRELKSIVGELEYSRSRLDAIYSTTRANAARYNYSESKVREYFLFVSIYVFDPISIVCKMRKGLRSDLADELGVSENNISHLTQNILFRHRHYRWFREDCDKIHTEALELIKRLEMNVSP